MKKTIWKRILLGLLQHLAAGGILAVAAVVLFNSYLTVETMNGPRTYALSPLHAEAEFEDTDTFDDIFRTVASDIMRLAVIKGELETNDVFDQNKPVDITAYANRVGKGNQCKVTAVYALEDLIKWGRYGVEYTNRSMSMSEFINYFGSTIAPEYFALDESGQLYFYGFDGRSDSNPELVLAEMEKYNREQLEDIVFSYIMTQTSEEITVSREDDGTLTVYLPLITCRYDTVGGERQLLTYAGNWVEYFQLQDNLEESISGLALAYEQYQNSNYLYMEYNSNVRYVIRMESGNGIVTTYTNVPDMQKAQESDITDFFSEYRRYLIYYPNSLESTGNTSMTETEVYHLLNEYEYAYPDSTHIWMGVDTSYAIQGDAFSNGFLVFERIVPNAVLIISACCVLLVLWAVLGLYFTVTSGLTIEEDGNHIYGLQGIDYIWTELLAVLILAFSYGVYVTRGFLQGIADGIYARQAEFMTDSMAGFYEYGIFAGVGFLASLLGCMLWYSLVRRLRCRNLWRNSFCNWLVRTIRKAFWFVVSHKSTAVSILIPYNVFLLGNLVGILCTYIFWERGLLGILILIALVAFDGFVGVMIFKTRAEQINIVEGINRIRDGEVDYKLDVESLHGDNREMADAVNNIGEGIRKAVKTSMKDEKMKTDLITNVSHDIKTPLTSIISYVDLLKRLKIEEEPIRGYIEVLDTKSQRLKQLTDDLVEASKISSGNIELNREPLNFAELLHQAIGEFSEKLEERGLQLLYTGGNLSAMIFADSRRMWRIIENLFNNICNYALDRTRIYVDLKVEEGWVEASIKNISARPMNIRPEELTERFVRGDSARSTEGTGLGLSIAQSLTQVQGGEFSIHLDGDLFKVVLGFAEYKEEPAKLPEQSSEEIADSCVQE